MELYGHAKSLVVENTMFYIETLKIIDTYLGRLPEDTPRSSLQHFIQKHCADAKPSRPNDTANTDKKGLLDGTGAGETCPSSVSKKQALVVGLRAVILTCMSLAKGRSKSSLREYHLYVHLVELGLDDQKTMYQKLSEFLNTNFALRPSNVAGHACRGNYEEIVKHSPTLAPAFEEYGHMLHDEETLEAWRKKFSVPDCVFKVVSGLYKDFGSKLEEHCYKLLNGLNSNYSDEFTMILQGNFELLAKDCKGWVRLVVLMVTTKHMPLREYELCFEHMFHETFDFDFNVGLLCLSYSRKCVFYFNVLLDKIQLDNQSVESLLEFAHKNRLDTSSLVRRYGETLQGTGRYEQLCRFALRHPDCVFEYSKDTMLYFIRNFPRLYPLAAEGFEAHSCGLFITSMGSIGCLDERLLQRVLESKHFDWFFEEIAGTILERDDVSDTLMLDLLRRVLEAESRTGASARDIKARIAQKLAR